MNKGRKAVVNFVKRFSSYRQRGFLRNYNASFIPV